MTRFRFRYKRVGHLRLRCRLVRRQAVLLVLLVAFATQPAARRAVPASAPPVPVAAVLRIGDYVVCEEGDPKLVGHPDIRY